jgi:hypothetical protein
MGARSIAAVYDHDLSQRIMDFRNARTSEEKSKWATSYLQLFIEQQPYLARARQLETERLAHMQLAQRQIAAVRERERKTS